MPKQPVTLVIELLEDRCAPATFPRAFPTPPPPIREWGVFGNNVQNDCVWAAFAHAAMLRGFRFTTANVLSDYRAAMGPDDVGTTMPEAFAYLQQRGIVDARGIRHRFGHFQIARGDVLSAKRWSARGIIVDLMLPTYATAQFDDRKPWAITDASSFSTYRHTVTMIGFHHGYFDVVTWGKVQKMTPEAFMYWNVSSYVLR